MYRSKLLALFSAFCALTGTANAAAVFVTDSSAGTVSTIVQDDLTGVWSGPSTYITGLTNPMGIALDTAGNIYVANSGNDEILKFDPFGQNGSVFASMGAVSWIAVDLLGNVFAVSTTTETLTKFDSTGSAVASRNSSTGMDAPGAITIGGDGYLYLVNGDGSGGVEIQRIDSGLTSINSFVTSGLSSPGGLAFLGGVLHVSNWFPPVTDQQVDRFDNTGTPLSSIVEPALGFSQGLGFVGGDLFIANDSQVSRLSGGALAQTFSFGAGSPMGIAVGAVPEPTTYAMIGGGLLMLSFLGRKRRSRS